MEKIKVHIADDHQILIDGIIAVLSSEENIEVVGYSLNGADVLNWFAANEADVLILDINMPKVDGIAVLQNFVKQNFQQKVIVLSSYDDVKLIKEVLKIGAVGFLAKKCAGENIVEAIIKVSKGEQYLEKSIQQKLLNTFNKQSTSKESISQDGPFFSSLTPRELEVLQLIARQYNTKEISAELHISVNTVETHRKNLISKLNVKNVVGLAIYALKNDLV
ncbi:response regulator transcription factor [Lutibacter sp.]|jgi:DNA-binding NarL/FixJ family response regulator|uniref:response regulator n=1 Tax=Lutibacter sp. TaxID=1925666 RepID=UPI001A2D027E|nr:response regulator transcription factor [Lutibacter sp.]MBI9040469.1 response regulator transcription factor [Lutibacter sp.]